jgi:hypothetical protein
MLKKEIDPGTFGAIPRRTQRGHIFSRATSYWAPLKIQFSMQDKARVKNLSAAYI